MKTFLMILSLLLLPITGFSQETNVPDKMFETVLIYLGYDSGDVNGSIPTANIDTVTTLDISGYDLENIDGIEDFADLEFFICSSNKLTVLDLSKNTALEYLDCYDNPLTSLDISELNALQELKCGYHNFTTLNLGKNESLKVLKCGEGLFEALELEELGALEELYCYKNNISNLDISKYGSLKKLSCGSNKMTELIIGQHANLEKIYCYENQLESIDISGASSLLEFKCNDNKLVSLDISMNKALLELDCSGNELENLDITKAISLTVLDCRSNNIINIDASMNPELETFFCSYNDLQILDLSKNLNLDLVECKYNHLVVLNLKNEYVHYIDRMNALNNPDLVCIQVDDTHNAEINWAWKKEETARYSTNCNYTGDVDFPELYSDVFIYPNPATTTFNVCFEFVDPQSIVLTLCDISGNKLLTKQLQNVLSINEDIDVSRLAAGTYFLSIDVGNTSVTRKLIVK
jgi:type IX secretion system substrate protein